MLKVKHYEFIRRKVLKDGYSQRAVSREFGYSRNMVRKALDFYKPPGYRRSHPPSRPAVDPVQHIIDAWMEEDHNRPRKQRHTAKRIYERLRDEYGFKGSYSAVSRYVKHANSTGGDVFFPLQFGPGEEAQVDWGEAWCVINGEERKVCMFCMRPCYSTSSFVQAYENERLESLLDGHNRAFEFFGGVFNCLAYDNTKSIVITVGKGQDRRLTKKFIELKSHYLFDTRFCNVRSGHEKGHVENLVKFAQRRFMTPLPEFSSLEELNAHLMAECRRDLQRKAARSDRTKEELFKEEQEQLLSLPPMRFPACIDFPTSASKQSLVRFDNNDYSVPVEYAHHDVLLKGFVDRVEIYCNHELVATHCRNYDKGEYVLNFLHYLPLLERKPGGIHNARPFKGEPWGENITLMRRELEYRYGGQGTKKFIKVLLLFTEFPVAAVKEAVRKCVRRRAFSEEAVKGVLTYQPRRNPPSLDLSNRPQLQVEVDGCRHSTVYDELLSEGL